MELKRYFAEDLEDGRKAILPVHNKQVNINKRIVVSERGTVIENNGERRYGIATLHRIV